MEKILKKNIGAKGHGKDEEEATEKMGDMNMYWHWRDEKKEKEKIKHTEEATDFIVKYTRNRKEPIRSGRMVTKILYSFANKLLFVKIPWSRIWFLCILHKAET